MAKKKKHIKHKGYTPPLTILDKFLYFLFLIFFSAVSISPIIISTSVQKNLTFSSPSAVAFVSTGGLWWAFPLSFYLIITTFVLFAVGYEQRIPLFGNAKLKYGEPPFKKEIYPIFRHKEYILDKSRKRKLWCKGIIIAWCIIFLVLLCIFPLALSGRKVLFDDSTVIVYSCLNREKIRYTIDDFDHITIDAYRSYSRYGSSRWVYAFTIRTTDGKETYFRNVLSEKAIDEFIEIKEQLEIDKITIKRSYNLENVIRQYDPDDLFVEKLYELFSTP